MKIGYSKTYPITVSGQWEKIWVEEDVDLNIHIPTCTDEDLEMVINNIRKVQYALKKQVENFHYESNKASEKQLQIVKEEDKDFLEAKKVLMGIESKAQAQEWLNNNVSWKYNIELKAIVNQKTK